MNAGKRYNSVCVELGKRGITREDIAEKLGIRYNSTVKYYPMPRFSPTILRRLELLREWGINPAYFEQEDAPMLLEEEKAIETEESLLAEMLKEIKRTVDLQRQMIERIEEQTRTITEQNNLIQLLQKNGNSET